MTLEQPTEEPVLDRPKSNQGWLPILAWGVAVIMVAMMAFLIYQKITGVPLAPEPVAEVVSTPTSVAVDVPLPALAQDTGTSSVHRKTLIDTVIPERSRKYAETYQVQIGDSVFSIAKEYDLEPESVLWANQDTLQDDPQMIEVGLNLNIPPVDGVYYKWKAGDTLEGVAGKYNAEPDDILLWPGNNLDLTDPVIEPGQYVMIPGGTGTFNTWVVPIAYSPHSGANRSINSQCSIPDGYYYGTGGFIYPTANHSVSGNDFWSGHLGVDYGAYLGDPVWAADSGIVVYAGGISGGYGNVVIIEHDTTYHVYHTVYAHLSVVSVRCGQSVVQGQAIGQAGSTGNSTGPHLHFEIRQDGAFINPHYVLP